MDTAKQELLAQSLRGIPELKYVNAENLVRYRAIMRYCYQEYKRLRYWLKPEDVHEALVKWQVWPEYTLDMCQSDLDQLVEWRNLTARHDGGRVTTLDEYLKKKMQYFMRPYSIEIERLLEALEKVTGFGGSLEATLFDRIASQLFAIRRDVDDMEPEAALELWNNLYNAFVSLHENAADYMASLQTARAEEMMVTESFLVFKDKLTEYLQQFVQALQRSAYQIEGNLLRINANIRDLFLERAVQGELNKPRLEEAPSKEELMEEMQQGFSNIQRWFIGESNSQSELTLLERTTKDAIARIVRSAIRIQERKRSGLSRKKELEHLARWFEETETLDEAHQLAAFTFGLFATRHLQGEDLRDSDRADMSSWEEKPMMRTLRSRSRKRGERRQSEPVRDNELRKQREREAFKIRQAEEWRMIEKLLHRGKVRISEMGVISGQERLKLLQWIGQCMTAGASKSFVTPEGVRIHLLRPEREDDRAILRAEDGELEMANYELQFMLTEAFVEAYAEVAPSMEQGGVS